MRGKPNEPNKGGGIMIKSLLMLATTVFIGTGIAASSNAFARVPNYPQSSGNVVAYLQASGGSNLWARLPRCPYTQTSRTSGFSVGRYLPITIVPLNRDETLCKGDAFPRSITAWAFNDLMINEVADRQRGPPDKKPARRNEP
jgi:hypothetical protein